MTDSQIRQYNLTKRLGEGRHGETWLAMDQALQRPVVIKFVPESLIRDSDFLERFEIEQYRLNELGSSHFAEYLGLDTVDNRAFIVREFVDGRPLYGITGGEPQFYRHVLEYLLGIARAVKAAHEASVPLQNVTSANVIVRDNGSQVLVDTGLPWSGSAASGPVCNLAAQYRAPEQLAGNPVDTTSDMFTLGIILWELMTGTRPFSGSDDHEILAAMSVARELYSGKVALHLPPDSRLLAKRLWQDDRDERLTAAELVASLEAMQVHHLRDPIMEEDEKEDHSMGDPRKYLSISVLALLLVILWLVLTY